MTDGEKSTISDKERLTWYHAVERMIERRMTQRDIDRLEDYLVLIGRA